MKVFSTPIQVCKCASIPYFKINTPIFCCPLFFEEYLNSQFRINKIGNEQTAYYHPSCSKLTGGNEEGRAWTPPTFSEIVLFQGCFPGNWLLCILQGMRNFLGPSIPRISSGAREKIRIYGVKITGRDICDPKNWIFLFLLNLPSKTLPQEEENYQFHPNSVFWKSVFLPAERGNDYRVKIWQKLNLWGYWTHVLRNSTIFATFTFLSSVLLLHNLDSVMLTNNLT